MKGVQVLIQSLSPLSPGGSRAVPRRSGCSIYTRARVKEHTDRRHLTPRRRHNPCPLFFGDPKSLPRPHLQKPEPQERKYVGAGCLVYPARGCWQPCE